MVDKCPFHGLCRTTSFFFSLHPGLFVGDSLLNMGPKHCAEMLSSVSKCKKAVMCFMEKIHVLGELWLGMNHCTVDHEFDV